MVPRKYVPIALEPLDAGPEAGVGISSILPVSATDSYFRIADDVVVPVTQTALSFTKKLLCCWFF